MSDALIAQIAIDQRAKIDRWFYSRKQRGRPSCPCGFIGGPRNIMSHRKNCPTWRAFVHIMYPPANLAEGGGR